VDTGAPKARLADRLSPTLAARLSPRLGAKLVSRLSPALGARLSPSLGARLAARLSPSPGARLAARLESRLAVKMGRAIGAGGGCGGSLSLFCKSLRFGGKKGLWGSHIEAVQGGLQRPGLMTPVGPGLLTLTAAGAGLLRAAGLLLAQQPQLLAQQPQLLPTQQQQHSRLLQQRTRPGPRNCSRPQLRRTPLLLLSVPPPRDFPILPLMLLLPLPLPLPLPLAPRPSLPQTPPVPLCSCLGVNEPLSERQTGSTVRGVRHRPARQQN